MAISVPSYDDVTLADLSTDPYPTYATLRAEAPVSWLAPARIHLVTKFDDIMRIEKDHETFPALDTRSLQIKAMGHSLMRRDGADHARQRKALNACFSPGTANRHWRPKFEAITDALIDEIADRGRADLFSDFAAPLASKSLLEILGLTNIDWQDLCVWSQALMDATGNYGDDAEVWARGKEAYDGIDRAIDERADALDDTDGLSALAVMLNAEDPLDIADVRANTKVIVGGGLNEPRDATCSLVLGLLSHPGQLAQVKADPALWRIAFEEAVRWIAPIGMYPRTVSREVEIGGARLDPGDQLGLSVASACHDETYFENAGDFDINRKRTPHLAFGGGPHFCAGTWIARMMVGQIAVPRLFARLDNLRLDPDAVPTVVGWVFRGPTSLPVVWDA